MTNEEVLDYVVKSVRIIRKQKKVSQTELCLRANMSQGYLTNLETGKQEPSVMTIIRIADALQVSPRDFFPEPNQQSEATVKDKLKKEIHALIDML